MPDLTTLLAEARVMGMEKTDEYVDVRSWTGGGCINARLADATIAELLAALILREKMLRSCFGQYVPKSVGLPYEDWHSGLRKRVEGGGT